MIFQETFPLLRSILTFSHLQAKLCQKLYSPRKLCFDPEKISGKQDFFVRVHSPLKGKNPKFPALLAWA